MSSPKTKKLPPKVESMTKEELAIFLQKKKQTEQIAQNIVIELLEEKITEEKLINCLPSINQTHYDDIVEERSIIKLCAYPVCNQMLKEIPKQQYKISIKNNKVFDITSRKKYCSNGCYKASEFLKDQLLTTPLWCRELEEMPEFKLMSIDTVGMLGEEVDLNIVKKVDVEPSKETDFQSLLDFTEASLTEISQDDQSKDVKLETIEVINANTNEESKLNDDSTSNENNAEKVEESSVDKVIKDEEEIVESKTKPSKKSNSCKIVGDVIERCSENKVDPFISEGMKLINKNSEDNATARENKENKRKHKQSVSIAIYHIEKCMNEWFTLKTMLFLLGQRRVKEMVIDKGEALKQFINNLASESYYKSKTYEQYQQLCKKLNLEVIKDKRFDDNERSERLARQLKPLPHYSMLLEESKHLNIKVRAYLKGQMEIPQYAKTEDAKNKTEQDKVVPKLPLVDTKSQIAMRRKIVLNGYNKVLPDLLQSLGITMSSITDTVKSLVNTFHLQAHNVVLNPLEWNMIAMITLKLLSIRDVNLADALKDDRASRHMQLLLMSYNQEGGYLERITLWLTDIDKLMSKM